jgi:hypothetical protein
MIKYTIFELIFLVNLNINLFQNEIYENSIL